MGGKAYKPTKCIAIDVDGTLIRNGRLNARLVEYIKRKRADGYEINLWSAAGKLHAVDIAERHGISSLFDAITSKPGYIVDDLGWNWTRYTKTVRGFV